MVFAQHVRQKLMSLIDDMAASPTPFVRNPSRDFVRKRKLDFKTMIHCLISMESKSLSCELLDFFHQPDSPSPSAFVQQRHKLLPEAFLHLFHSFNRCFPQEKNYRGFRLIACDGSDLSVPRNPDDKESFYKRKNDTYGYNFYHLDALYDICNKRYLDMIITPGKSNERQSMAAMVDRSCLPEKTIFLADRGYESYNTFAHVMEKHMYYLIRVKDNNKSSIMSGLQLPDTETFDTEFSFELTRKHTNEIKEQPERYRRITSKHGFDYLDLEQRLFYPVTLRVLRFAIHKNRFECIITNLPKDTFRTDEIKKLYAMRWGIETSFRQLKYTIGLDSFHSRKVESIKQEIYARLILYNYCQIITTAVSVTQKNTKHIYQINVTAAFQICRCFLKNKIPPPHVEALIQKNLLPVRPGRCFHRNIRYRAATSFLYRY